VDFVTTSTGFAPSGCAVEDVKLMRMRLPEGIGVEAAGGLRTLDQVLEIRAAGAARISTSSPAAILEQWTARLAAAGA
jgi:deoxyribose-phosphate aldolase